MACIRGGGRAASSLARLLNIMDGPRLATLDLQTALYRCFTGLDSASSDISRPTVTGANLTRLLAIRMLPRLRISVRATDSSLQGVEGSDGPRTRYLRRRPPDGPDLDDSLCARQWRGKSRRHLPRLPVNGRAGVCFGGMPLVEITSRLLPHHPSPGPSSPYSYTYAELPALSHGSAHGLDPGTACQLAVTPLAIKTNSHLLRGERLSRS